MVTAKKLICGHLFHMHCLRSWLERQHTCPTCRAPVVPPENGTTTAGGQFGPHSDFRQHGNCGLLFSTMIAGCLWYLLFILDFRSLLKTVAFIILLYLHIILLQITFVSVNFRSNKL